MSDRIAVFSHGRIDQIGSPTDVYERPRTEFVAGFVGVSNVLSPAVASAVVGESVAVTIRPEKIRLLAPDAPTPPDHVTVAGIVRDVVYLGTYTRYLVELSLADRTDGVDLTVVVQNTDPDPNARAHSKGTSVQLAWLRAATRPLSADETQDQQPEGSPE